MNKHITIGIMAVAMMTSTAAISASGDRDHSKNGGWYVESGKPLNKADQDKPGKKHLKRSGEDHHADKRSGKIVRGEHHNHYKKDHYRRPVPHYSGNHGYPVYKKSDSDEEMLIGGILGAIIGNRIAEDDRAAGTVIGALLGTGVGYAIGHDDGYAYYPRHNAEPYKHYQRHSLSHLDNRIDRLRDKKHHLLNNRYKKHGHNGHKWGNGHKRHRHGTQAWHNH